GSARAAEVAPPAGELELRLGMGRRSDSLATPDLRANAEGGALSDLALAGAWFGSRAHVGLAARGSLVRFALRAPELAGALSPGEVSVVGGTAAAGLAVRAFAWGGRLRFDGDVGWGYAQVPVVAVDGPTAALTSASLRGHGPSGRLGVALGIDALALELGAEA